jgi:hypothetical protein
VNEEVCLIEYETELDLVAVGEVSLDRLLEVIRHRATRQIDRELVYRLERLQVAVDYRGGVPVERWRMARGYLPYLCDLLDSAGVEYTLGPYQAPTAVGLASSEIAPELAKLAKSFCGAFQGQVVLERSSQIPDTILTLYRHWAAKLGAYPLRMLVGCKSTRAKLELAEELSEHTPEHVEIVTDGEELRVGLRNRIMVANNMEFASAATDPDAGDVYVVVDGHVGCQKKVGEALALRPRVPRFVLYTSRESLDPLQEMTLAARFGLTIYDEGAQPPQEYRIPLATIYAPAPPPASTIVDRAEVAAYKRRTLWCCPTRNAYIARLARGVEERQPEILASLGVEMDGELEDRIRRGATVCIVVENVEHANALQALLPTWAIKARGQAAERDAEEARSEMTVEDEEVEVSITLAEFDRTIVTETRLEADRLDTQIVIRSGISTGNLDNTKRSTGHRHRHRWLLSLEEPRFLPLPPALRLPSPQAPLADRRGRGGR